MNGIICLYQKDIASLNNPLSKRSYQIDMTFLISAVITAALVVYQSNNPIGGTVAVIVLSSVCGLVSTDNLE